MRFCWGFWLDWRRYGISRFALGFIPAFGRVECRFATGFRREAEASLYLAATATANARANAVSLHCAMDGEAVRGFGRDDVVVWDESSQKSER
jgi:hypothetical protein